MPTFLSYPKLHNVVVDNRGDSPYADALDHCQRYDYYSVRGQRVTSVHECTHGINSQLRNRPLHEPQEPDSVLQARAMINRNVPHIVPLRLPQPAQIHRGAERLQAGFYLLEDQAIMLVNPLGTISEAAKLVPSSMRYSRFNLYMVKQASQWNNEPLYIFDEWVAYRNGAKCLIWDAQHGGTQDGNSDFIFAPLEFCTYGVAVLKMAAGHGELAPSLIDFARWLLADCFNVYFIGKEYAPWGQADKLFVQLQTATEFNTLRQFCLETLSFPIPDGKGPTNMLI